MPKQYAQEQLDQFIQRGQELRKMRESLGLYLDNAGALLQVSDTTIWKIEHGHPVQVQKYADRLEAAYLQVKDRQSKVEWEIVDEEEEDIFGDTNQSSKSHEQQGQQEEPEAEEGLVRVEFQGDVLTAVERDGKVWVSVRRVCEALGVDSDNQIEKIDKDSVLKSTTFVTEVVAKDGKKRRQVLISTKGLVLWLANIPTSRVSSQAAQKLTAYKLECAEVLERHFFGQKQQQQSSSFGAADLIAILAEQNRQTMLQVAEINRQAQIENRLFMERLLGAKATEIKTETEETAREAAKQAIQQEQQKAREEMRQEDFIPPMGPPRPLSLRADINKRVETYVNVTMGGIGYSESYNRLYSQFEARYRIDLKRRASEETERRKRKAAGGQMSFSIEDEPADRKKEYPYYPKDAKGTKVAPMDIAQWMGCLVDLHALACELFHIGPNEGGKEGGEQYAA